MSLDVKSNIALFPEIKGVSFGPFLRSLREQAGFSLRRLSEKLFVSATYLSKIERDLEGAPAEATLWRLSEELKARPLLLFGMANKIPALLKRKIVECQLSYYGYDTIEVVIKGDGLTLETIQISQKPKEG